MGTSEAREQRASSIRSSGSFGVEARFRQFRSATGKMLSMQANRWCSTALLMCLGLSAFASPGPVPGTEDIPKLIAVSELVCKGEVVEAPTPTFVPSPAGMPRLTVIANVRPDRCFKGSPNGALIPVLVDGFVSGTNPSFVLRKGDYRLLFLKAQNGKYAVVDEWFGALPVSTELGSLPKGSDGMFQLELDLKAGLRDSNPERVLDSIRMLGNMKHLHSTSELGQLLDHSDLLVKTYVWQALLRLKDYSVLPAVSEFFDSQPEPPHELLMPRDRLFEMQFELTNEIGVIRDPGMLPFLEGFAVTGKGYSLRMSALQALRAIGSPHSAAALLAALDDSNSDNAFSAMQGLLSLGGDGLIDWVPTWKQFDEAPRFYAAKCREWWHTQGEQKAADHTLGQPL
jgi:PBS lyase HEAT-like repeat